ncbi:MAG: ParB N-terminal domain-containing protein [Anaerolineae bacterium]|nr:ParB N-terminal domain-containing protein [Anaerolineae bacterium]
MMARANNDNTSRIDDLLASVTGDLLGDMPQTFTDNSIRVERILLEMVRPDPVQPRRVLPESIHLNFHNNRVTPTQALRELVQIVQIAARQRGRPFNNVLELLPNGDDEREDEPAVNLSPEETLLRDLVNLAMTIRDDGQVNPLTVVDVSQGVTRLFRIETGERRYWATWLLRDFIPGYTGDGMIPCIIIPANRSSVFRQAKENTARSGLTAVALARQAALLLLTVHGYEIPAYAVGNDFFRQALDLNLRARREYTDVILSAMGGMERTQFSRIKNLLRLSDEALELADRHAIDEFKLRCVIATPQEYHAEIVRQIIDFNLSAKQVKEICEGDTAHQEKNMDDVSPSAAKMAKVTQTISATTPQELARALMRQEGDASIARARLQAMQKLLGEAERYLKNE